jgi:hypothetical protein
MHGDEKGPLTVLFCRGQLGPGAGGPAVAHDAVPADLLSDEFGPILAECHACPVVVVGARPGKSIDPRLTGRVLVVGDDADLNAVVLRLLRRDLLGAVEVAYAPAAPTAVTALSGLPAGPAAVRAALRGASDEVPLARNDSGGVLIGRAELAPVTGALYVDAQRVPGGAEAAFIEPEPTRGLAVTVVRRPFLRRKSVTYTGRAVEFGIVPGSGTTITFDGIRHPRDVNRWVFYRHTQPLRLVRPARS